MGMSTNDAANEEIFNSKEIGRQITGKGNLLNFCLVGYDVIPH